MKSNVEQLYRDHGHAVLRRARRLLRNDDDAHDVLHDVFVNLYRSGERFAERSSVVTYLYSMTTHQCLNRLRNRRTRARLLGVESAAWPRLVPARGEGQILAREILEALSAEDASLALYLYCDELTHDEIAALLGCSRRTVGNLEQRLAARIRELVPERGCA